MAKQYKNDVFEVLKNIDYKNYGYYDSLTDEQKKEIQPYTLMRWKAITIGNGSENNLLNVNEKVNKHFWELSKYKDLQWKLLCTCNDKPTYQRHQWIPMCKNQKNKDYEMVKNFYVDLTDAEVSFKFNGLSKTDIKQIKEYLGLANK